MKGSEAVAFVGLAAVGAIIGTIAVNTFKRWLAGEITVDWLKATA